MSSSSEVSSASPRQKYLRLKISYMASWSRYHKLGLRLYAAVEARACFVCVCACFSFENDRGL